MAGILPQEAMPSLVASRLEYYNWFYIGLPLKIVRKLQLEENATIWISLGKGHKTPETFDIQVRGRGVSLEKLPAQVGPFSPLCAGRQVNTYFGRILAEL